jgi:hypothetical protein
LDLCVGLWFWLAGPIANHAAMTTRAPFRSNGKTSD